MTQPSSQQSCSPQELHPGPVLVVLMVGTFLAPLDSSIVNIILPGIATEFGRSLTQVSWVATAYLLTNAALLLSMGRLGDLWGLRRVYAGGMVLFGIGSLLCAASPSLSVLIAARVVQAVGASMIFASGPALVTRAFPPDRRGGALGLISLSVSAGLTVGPALGGVLLHSFGWQSVFLINVPLAVLVAALAWRLLPGDDCAPGERFDALGAVLAGGALLALLLGLTGAGSGPGPIAGVVGLVVAGVFAVAFVWWESRAAHPMLDLRLFRSRSLSSGVAAAMLSFVALFAVTFTMPFYLLRIEGLDARAAGLILTATPLSMALVAPVSGRLSDRWGSRGLATTGLLVLALGLVGLSFIEPAVPIWWVPVTLVVIGGGTAIFQAPNTAAVLRAAPHHRAGIASALVAEARNVGMALGIGLTAAVVAASMGGAVLPGGEGAVVGPLAEDFVTGMSIALRLAAALTLVAAFISLERLPVTWRRRG